MPKQRKHLTASPMERASTVSAAYNHALHLKARTKMMQDWSDFLQQTQHGAKILVFPAEVA